MKIIAEEKLRGTKTNFPTIGVTDIPEDGILDLENELAASLVESKIGYSYLENKKKKEDKEVGEQFDEIFDITTLENLSLAELIDIAKTTELPIKEWEKFSKNTKKARELMIVYLGKKLK